MVAGGWGFPLPVTALMARSRGRVWGGVCRGVLAVAPGAATLCLCGKCEKDY